MGFFAVLQKTIESSSYIALGASFVAVILFVVGLHLMGIISFNWNKLPRPGDRSSWNIYRGCTTISQVE